MVVVDIFCFPHHGEKIFSMVWAVGIFGCVAIGMMHPVKDSISSRGEVGAALTNPGKDIEESFPKPAHFKHLMGSITVKKKALAKQREIPVKKKEGYNDHLL